jgi:hypothetical protein
MPDQHVSMSAEFGKRFLLFVDTEEEFDWAEPRRRDAVGTTAISALPAAHQRLKGFGLTPTYMVDFPVADNARSADIVRGLADDGGAAIGAQLHPWVNPPLDESMSSSNSFVGNLPIDIERAKLKLLTDRISQSLGSRPIIYRAGRYGIGPNTAGLLIQEGYRLDVSTRPLFNYHGEGGPDFSGFPAWPWWVEREHGLIELPLGVAFTGHLRRLGRSIYPIGAKYPPLASALARAGLLQRVALTPEGTPLADAILAIDEMVGEGDRVFSLSFHSPSIAPGHTPYVRDNSELAIFWRWWDGVLNHFARHGIKSARVIEFIEAADRSR